MAYINKHIFETFESFNEASNSKINFDVEYTGDFEGADETELKKTMGWKFSPVPPITVVSVSGSVDGEKDEIEITLSDDTNIEFSGFYEIGPGSPIAGRKDPNYGKLTINGTLFDVKDDFIDNLEQYGSIILAILKCYEKIIKKNNIKR